MQATSTGLNEPETRIQFSVWRTFRRHIPRFLITVFFDVILPLLIFFALQERTKPVLALLAASSPPLIMVIFKAIFLCTFDPLGFLIFVTFLLSAIVAIVTRSSLILLLEKSLVTLIMSLIFTLTLIPFPCFILKPLAYYFYQDLVPTSRSQLGLPCEIFNEQVDDHYMQLEEERQIQPISLKEEISRVYQWMYINCKSFRHSCYFITSVWAIGYFLEFLARFTLIMMRLPIQSIVVYGHIILSTITIICIVLTISTITIERRETLTFIERWKIQQTKTRINDSTKLSIESGKAEINLASINNELDT